MRKTTKELFLLLFMVLIAAMINSLVASQRMAPVFYFLPTLYSAYYFGRRHATLTALGSVILVVLLTFLNPALLSHRIDHLSIDPRWFDLTVWGGILVVAGYAMGTLYERNQKSLNELKDGYEGMLVILQHFLANQKYSEAHSYRISMYATKIAESLGLDGESIEDIRMAALLRNVNELGISNEILYKAANLSQEDVEKGIQKQEKTAKAQAMGGSLRRAIPILVAEQQLTKTGRSPAEAEIEVQVLALAEKFESLISDTRGGKMSPAQAVEAIAKGFATKYDSMIVDAFVKAFGQQAQGAGA